VGGVLAIELTFPRGTYSGSELGTPEELPSHARLYEALVAAAAGGPWATPSGRVLVACDAHRHALQWLEDHEPVAVVVPSSVLSASAARRYRWRASPVALDDTDFEPVSALDGPVTFVWPEAPDEIGAALREISAEVTHVGRADSVVIVRVRANGAVEDGPRTLRIAAGRGPGRVMRVPVTGRLEALERAHAASCRVGSHGSGSLGKQAPDKLVTGANEEATAQRRFAPSSASIEWPYAEVWRLPIDARGWAHDVLTVVEHRVAAAVGIHRALVSAIGEDVPSFITGRDGDAPLRGPGHLAVHVVGDDSHAERYQALLALPQDVVAADRQRLREVVSGPLRARIRLDDRRVAWFSLGALERIDLAAPFWRTSGLLHTRVPMALEATGAPRRGSWTLDDAAICSVGYALRGVLESEEFPWGKGWTFRRHLVDRLREEHGVDVRTRRTRASASRFVHRVEPGSLVVAVDAVVDLGDLMPKDGAGFLALGRARHLGGGLLHPITEVSG